MRFFYNRFLQIKFGQIFSVHIDSLYWTLEGRKRNYFFCEEIPELEESKENVLKQNSTYKDGMCLKFEF